MSTLNPLSIRPWYYNGKIWRVIVQRVNEFVISDQNGKRKEITTQELAEMKQQEIEIK